LQGKIEMTKIYTKGYNYSKANPPIVIRAKSQVLPSLFRFITLPFSLATGFVGAVLECVLPGRLFYGRRTGLFGMLFFFAKVTAVGVCAALIFNPGILGQLDANTRNAIGLFAILGGVLGLLGSVSSAFSVALLCCFWLAATVYLSQSLLSGVSSRNGNTYAAVPKSLPGGMKYQDIPDYAGKLGEELEAFGNVPDLSNSFSVDLSKLNPVSMMGNLYDTVGSNIGSGLSSVSNSVSGTVDSQIASLSQSIGLGGTSFASSFQGGSSGLPDFAFFPVHSKSHNFYPMRGGKKSPVDGIMDSIRSKLP